MKHLPTPTSPAPTPSIDRASRLKASPVSRYWPAPAGLGVGLLAWNFFANGPFGLGIVRAPIATLLWLAASMALLHYTKVLWRRSWSKNLYQILALSGMGVGFLFVVLPVLIYGIALEFNPLLRFYF